MRKACERCTNKKLRCVKTSDSSCKECYNKGLECYYTRQRNAVDQHQKLLKEYYIPKMILQHHLKYNHK